MTDILAPYRRPGAAPPQAEPTPEATQAGYVAFGVASGAVKPQRLDIRCARGLAVARAYSALSEIAYDREGYTGILLFWPGKLVTIKGYHLKPVVEALLAGTCEYLAELDDGSAWQPGAPVITRITTAGPNPAGSNPPGRATARASQATPSPAQETVK